MKLSIIVPVYNEKDTVRTVLARVQALDIPKQIIIVDNCSTDGTREIVASMAGPGVEVVLQPRNMGKGTSIRTAIPRCRGEYTIIQDGDLEYDPSDIARLLDLAHRQNADAVFGSRIKGAGAAGLPPSLRSYGRNAINWLFNVLYHARLTDVATCYKLVRTRLLQSLDLRCSGFDLDFELPAKLRKRGVEIHEAPISYVPRSVQEGQKLRYVDGIPAVWCLIKCRVLG
jgi:dolichol-phosphate mannosyltransferase